MKTTLQVIIFIALVCAASAQQKLAPDIVSPVKRQVSISLAEKLSKLHMPSDVRVPDNLTNPFDPLRSQPAVQATRPTSDRELLATLLGQLNPTGTAVLGGEPYLLFGQKRIKVGEKIPISFENVAYELEIVAIERITFTVRYNQEELSRPVTISNTNKPGKNP